MCQKAPTSGADLVFLDLEDACAPNVKESARSIAIAALTEQEWGRVVRAVRVNGLDTPWCYGDVVEIVTKAGAALDVIIVPDQSAERLMNGHPAGAMPAEYTGGLGSDGALALKQEFQTFTGTITNGNVVTPITDGRLKGDEITFTAGGVDYSGKVDGGTIAGTTKSGETWQAKRAARAAPSQVAAPQAGRETPAPETATPAAPATAASSRPARAARS